MTPQVKPMTQSSAASNTFAPALSHGPIVEVFADIFQVTGSFRMGPGVVITRNMTILRQAGELTLVNSVRLTPAGLAELDKLGKVTNLMKIGAFHGMDDPFYVDRYQPKFWAPPGVRHSAGLQHTADLTDGLEPLPNTSVFAFAHGKHPEVALIIARHGGLLLTCDSLQNWTSFAGASLLAKVVLSVLGFGPKHIGGPWTKAMGPGVQQDLVRLLDMPFATLLPAHGTVLRDHAKEGLREAITKRFG
jgi:hypothetical protein